MDTVSDVVAGNGQAVVESGNAALMLGYGVCTDVSVVCEINLTGLF
jgi:hypothetical protein